MCTHIKDKSALSQRAINTQQACESVCVCKYSKSDNETNDVALTEHIFEIISLYKCKKFMNCEQSLVDLIGQLTLHTHRRHIAVFHLRISYSISKACICPLFLNDIDSDALSFYNKSWLNSTLYHSIILLVSTNVLCFVIPITLFIRLSLSVHFPFELCISAKIVIAQLSFTM